MEREKIIIDTDIGDDIDDIYALGYALKRPELKILGITTVWGDVHKRALITRKLLAVAGREDIPVYAGCDLTLNNSVLKRSHINHYTDDMADYTYEKQHAVDYIIETLMNSDGDISFMALGAATNIAMALIKEPRIKEKIKRVFFMGACFDGHFLTWNVICDPDAAKVLNDSGLPLTYVTRDTTKDLILTPEVVEQFCKSDDAVSKMCGELTAPWKATSYRDPSMFDAATITAIFDESLFEFEDKHLLVETSGRYTRGFILDVKYDFGHPHFYPISNFPRIDDIPVVKTTTALDREKYMKHYIDCMLNDPIVQD